MSNKEWDEDIGKLLHNLIGAYIQEKENFIANTENNKKRKGENKMIEDDKEKGVLWYWDERNTVPTLPTARFLVGPEQPAECFANGPAELSPDCYKIQAADVMFNALRDVLGESTLLLPSRYWPPTV